MISRIAMGLRPFAAIVGGIALSCTVACDVPAAAGFDFNPRKNPETDDTTKDTKSAPGGGSDTGGDSTGGGADGGTSDGSRPNPSDGGTGTDGNNGRTPAQCTAPDLIACFPLDNDIIDYSTNRLSTTQTGTISFTPGKNGDAVNLSSGSSVVIAGTNVLDAAAVTVEAYVRWIENDKDVAVFNAVGRYTMIIEDGGDLRCQTPEGSVSGGEVPKNQWAHIACVFNGNDARVFINGKREDDGGADIRTSPGSGGSIGGTFAGAIDEVRVFRGAKSDAALAAR